MIGGITPGRLLALVAALVVALLALRVPLGYWTDGPGEAAGILAGGTGTLLGLVFAVRCSTRRAAVYAAAVVGVCAALAAVAPLAFDFLALGGPYPEYGLWGAAVRGLLEFCVAALLVTWVRSSGAGRDPGTTNAVDGASSRRRVREIYRSKRQRTLLGVCGGLAEAVGLDPARLRWAAVLGAVFTTSAALLVYLLLALLIAPAPDQGEDTSPTERSLA